MKDLIAAFLLVGLTSQIVSAQNSKMELGLVSGDVIKCYDDVANLFYQIKIIDVGDEAASIVIKNASGQVMERIKPQDISFGEHSEGAYFVVAEKKVNRLAGIELDKRQLSDGAITGFAYDRGDSRAVECFKK